MFDGYTWRTRREAIITAYYTASYTVGNQELPSLAELLDDTPALPPSPDEYHRRMRELGLE